MSNKFRFNDVQVNSQWRRRIQAEEMQLLDSFAGPKSHQIQGQITLQRAQHFYSNGARIVFKDKPTVLTVRDNKKLKESLSPRSLLDQQALEQLSSKQNSVKLGNLSVRTPSITTAPQSSKAESVRTKYTSLTEKNRIEALQQELDQERARRVEAEENLIKMRDSKEKPTL